MPFLYALKLIVYSQYKPKLPFNNTSGENVCGREVFFCMISFSQTVTSLCLASF